MTDTQKGLFILLKSAVTGEKLVLPDNFILEEADEVIRKQSLLPLAYMGAYNCGISLKAELMQKYQKEYYRILIHSERQIRAVNQIFEAFEENGIDYMPLKGCNMKLLYPQPEMRMMGDADILIREEQYHRIKPIMQSLGFHGGEESDHDYSWKREDLYVELHKRLFASRREVFYSYFGDGWSRAVKKEKYRYILPIEDEFLYIFTHMTRHYKDGGIGCRHLLDLYVFRNVYTQLNEEYIQAGLNELKLSEFYQNIYDLLDAWFFGGELNDKTRCIMEYVFSGGNWGSYETYLASKIKLSNEKKHVRGVKKKALWRMLFLPLREMQDSYKILIKYPWLCPLFWVIRWFRVFVRSPKAVVRKLLKIGRLQEDKVYARQTMIKLVGLSDIDE